MDFGGCQSPEAMKDYRIVLKPQNPEALKPSPKTATGVIRERLPDS